MSVAQMSVAWEKGCKFFLIIMSEGKKYKVEKLCKFVNFKWSILPFSCSLIEVENYGEKWGKLAKL